MLAVPKSRLYLYAAGGAVAVVAVYAWRKLGDLATGDPNLDRLRLRALYFSTLYGVDARVTMALIANESEGRPENYVGDVSLSSGPSIGPMQVLRKTAQDYALLPPELTSDPDAYLALAQDESLGISLGVRVFKRKLQEAGGNVQDAVRRYNGAGVAADSYRDRALAFIQSTYGGLA
jgi:soluble lytic murein transglycosylase-like protein